MFFVMAATKQEVKCDVIYPPAPEQFDAHTKRPKTKRLVFRRSHMTSGPWELGTIDNH